SRTGTGATYVSPSVIAVFWRWRSTCAIRESTSGLAALAPGSSSFKATSETATFDAFVCRAPSSAFFEPSATTATTPRAIAPSTISFSFAAGEPVSPWRRFWLAVGAPERSGGGPFASVIVDSLTFGERQNLAIRRGRRDWGRLSHHIDTHKDSPIAPVVRGIRLDAAHGIRSPVVRGARYSRVDRRSMSAITRGLRDRPAAAYAIHMVHCLVVVDPLGV